ncbi:glutathione S-transferase 1-1-like [Schistocerca cancellata]|uniref:glutathione S-transferase 1-1-like n=1 Tax=Schistocerca cancellata TaxID=274614 RepID=UPI00211979FB|nr:glutathione S-transferase 1-1-like [Schistocerca cancellata]
MAPLTLYVSPLSAPCRLVRLVASIVGVDLKIVNVNDLANDLKTPEMLKKNPQHTVPTLEDNGLYVAESRAIAMYLISKYGKNDALYPKDVNRRVLVDQRLFFDQDFYSRIVNVFRPKFVGKQTDPSNIDKVNDRLESLNRMLEGKQWLAGDNVSLADYAVAISLTAIELVPESGIVPTKHPNIKEWLHRVESSTPKYMELLKTFREGVQELLKKFKQ